MKPNNGNLTHVNNKAIRAMLVGDCSATALDISVSAYSPATALARALVAAGTDPARTIAFYRGAVMCLRGRLGAFAGLTVQVDSRGTPRFVPWRGARRNGADVPVAFAVSGLAVRSADTAAVGAALDLIAARE